MTKRFYTNVQMNGRGLRVRGYGEDGKREHFTERQFKPYLFLPSQNADSQYHTLEGNPVEKMVFDSFNEARTFTERYQDVVGFKYYGMDTWVYPYIYDTYGMNIPHDTSLIKTGNLDIEVMSNEGFPRPEEATKMITAITVRCRGVATVFGLHQYNPQRLRDMNIEPSKNVKYIICTDEVDMLEKFLKHWKEEDFDIITGWNVNGFDIPYLHNRIKTILGDGEEKRLSPWGTVTSKTITGAYGRDITVYNIQGITILDYLEMYRKFCPGSRESFKLDYIGKYEKVDVVKFDYEELGYKNLHDLYERNYDLYIHYNIIDTEVVDNLEAKLKLIQLVIVMSYNSGLNYQDTLTTVRLWDVTIHGYLMSKGIVIPGQRPRIDGAYGGIEGAYVKDPIVGLSKWVASFDVNSLYPSLIRQCNISPETYVSTVRGISVGGLLNTDPRHPPTEKNMHREADPSVPVEVDTAIFKKLTGANVGICGTGCVFRNDIQGFYPYLMEYYYAQRTHYKDLLKTAKKQLDALKEIKASQADIEKVQRDISTYDMFQYSFKIMLNSAYGALSNTYYRWFDPKMSESVTKTGQLTIRWVERDINFELNKLLGTTGEKFVIYCDTDSAYVRLEKIVEERWSGLTDEQIVDHVDKFCKEVIEPIIEESFKRFTAQFNHRENVLVMKREAIANKGIWTAKKRYILNVWDMEGFRYKEPQLKMQGIEAVKSSTPAAARVLIKDALSVIMNKSEKAFLDFLDEGRKHFYTLPFDQVAFPRSCNNLATYTDKDFVFKKGCPIHVRGALVFNHLVRQRGLSDEIALIEEGEKIKFCHMSMPNHGNENIFATTGEMPKQLDMARFIDYRKQFNKGVLDPIRNICDAIGWDYEKRPSLEDLFI